MVADTKVENNTTATEAPVALHETSSLSWIRFSRAINCRATKAVYTNSMKVFMRYMKVKDNNNADKLLSGTNEQVEDSIMGFIAAQKQEALSTIARYGPFVMNGPQEVEQAIEDYRTGRR